MIRYPFQVLISHIHFVCNCNNYKAFFNNLEIIQKRSCAKNQKAVNLTIRCISIMNIACISMLLGHFPYSEEVFFFQKIISNRIIQGVLYFQIAIYITVAMTNCCNFVCDVYNIYCCTHR